MAGRTDINIEDTVGGKKQDGDVPPKKSLFKRLLTIKMIIIYCIVLLLIIGSLAAWWFFFLKNAEKAAREKARQAEQQAMALKKKKPPLFKDIVELSPFVKMTLRPSGNFSFITMKIALQLADNNMRQSIEAEKNVIRPIVKRETEKMTWFVLRTPEGKLRLKYRLIEKINSAVSKSSKAKINNLYFTYFVMQ